MAKKLVIKTEEVSDWGPRLALVKIYWMRRPDRWESHHLLIVLMLLGWLLRNTWVTAIAIDHQERLTDNWGLIASWAFFGFFFFAMWMAKDQEFYAVNADGSRTRATEVPGLKDNRLSRSLTRTVEFGSAVHHLAGN